MTKQKRMHYTQKIESIHLYIEHEYCALYSATHIHNQSKLDYIFKTKTKKQKKI